MQVADNYLKRYGLRRNGSIWMADAGAPMRRKIVGHGSLTTTQRYLPRPGRR